MEIREAIRAGISVLSWDKLFLHRRNARLN